MSELEVRQLRYFVAVAEELHFRRAADRLGIAQPPLSRAIRDLERQLGVRLLERTTRSVVLTPAGEGLLRDARIALDAVGAAAARARHAGLPEPRLRLALKADYDAGLLPRIIAAYERADAAIPVDLILGGRDEQAPALREGRADVALLPAPFDDRDLEFEPLLTEPRLVALAATDPLAARPDLYLADLAGRLLPDGSPADQPDSRLAEAADIPSPASSVAPAVAPAVLPAADRPRDLAQIFSLVELGRIVWFPPASLVRRHPRPDIAYRPVHDLAPSTLAMAWPRNSRSPAVAALVHAATTVAATATATSVGAFAATSAGAGSDAGLAVRFGGFASWDVQPEPDGGRTSHGPAPPPLPGRPAA
ncbi:LysR family transcriptional regulator [Parafrankia sp. EUN1f]|uniref:LysR family transcriptional regulator n=1 Tax=Parafrankia sp. EUN1f TaxID=102897 RepID=UPI0001C44D65|nr:LysR family transcriptional regulator [Parafrankia sp. EUN1f]EFC85556.1 transcriptional regulator, LysR family [Parafrankia sp. EUN1f]